MTRTVSTSPPTRAATTHAEMAYVETLTDEELAVLDDTVPDDAAPVSVRPCFDELSRRHQDVARQVAFRGLLARGIVDPPSPIAVAAAADSGGGPYARVDVLVRQDVQSLIALRRGATLMVALARTTSAGQDYWYGYLINHPIDGTVDDLALVEEVSDAGLHRFSLLHAGQLLDLLVETAVHPEAVDATGAPVAMPDGPPSGPPPPILQTLGQAFLRVDAVVRYQGRVVAPMVSLYTGPAGSWLVQHRGTESSVAFPMRAHELREHLRATVREARRARGGHCD